MIGIDRLVESRIEDARRQGVFENLEGIGQPLLLDDVAHIPEELRAAYRILKNAGYVPREVQLRSEIGELQALVKLAATNDEMNKRIKRLNFLMIQLEACSGHPSRLSEERDYLQKAADKF